MKSFELMDTIVEKLHEIEHEENVRILLAVESGSRAWGFASPDSDYDVRFIYVHPLDWYLGLEKKRDVIELPINDDLDINGWDLSKTLQLLHKSNPTLFEWFSSPIVYIETEFAGRFREFMKQYYSSKSGLAHYLSMASSNYHAYLRGDVVKAKKYFYVLRPVLACKWILEKGSQPPMLFSELMESELAPEYVPILNELLDIKMNRPEIHEIPQIPELNAYLDNSFSEVQERLNSIENDQNDDWSALNEMFLRELGLKNS